MEATVEKRGGGGDDGCGGGVDCGVGHVELVEELVALCILGGKGQQIL